MIEVEPLVRRPYALLQMKWRLRKMLDSGYVHKVELRISDG